MDSLLNDLRYALRSLRHSPGFAAAAVLTLAIGIGANTAIFSIVDHVIIRPLAYEDPDRLYVVHEVIPRLTHMTSGVPVSANHFLEWKRTSQSFESMALLESINLNLTGSGEPEQILGARASADLFPMLGIRAQLGRVFLPEEDAVGRDRVVVLDNELWRRRFAANPQIVGRTITLNDLSYSVVGVLPAEFRFPKIADLFQMTVYEGRPQIWKPLALTTEEATTSENFNFSSIVRLKQSASPAVALQELNRAQAEIVKAFPGFDLFALMIPLDEQITGRSKAGLQLLLGAVGVVLLIGCVNITNLLLVRATSRRREMAVRSAIGASSNRLLRQALSETTVLCVLGGFAALLIAHAVLQGIVAFAPVDLPRMDEVRLDARVFGFTLLLSLVATVACGVLPAWQLAKADPQDAMKSASRTTTSGRAAGRLRSMLVAAEVAMSAICLVAAGLLLHSFVKLLDVDPGFRSERVITVDITLPAARYPTGPKRGGFYRAILDEIASIPGVTSAGTTNGLPVTARGGNSAVFLEGATGPLFERPLAEIRNVNPDFFRTLSIPLRSGVLFSESDGDRLTAVISASLAERAWPGQEPIGKRFRFGSERGPSYEVVGVVGDVRGAMLSGNQQFPTIYVPYWRRAFNQTTLVVKTTDEVAATYALVRQAIRRLDAQLPVPALQTMDDVVMTSLAPRQFQMRLVLSFGIIALLLASLGIYAVVSHSVAQRTSEIGIRIAMGAAPQRIAGAVLRRAMWPVVGGLTAGLVITIAAGRVLHGMLFGVTPTDVATLTSVTALLIGVGLAASYLPARRAMRLDAMAALRTE
jgi:predicted permease